MLPACSTLTGAPNEPVLRLALPKQDSSATPVGGPARFADRCCSQARVRVQSIGTRLLDAWTIFIEHRGYAGYARVSRAREGRADVMEPAARGFATQARSSMSRPDKPARLAAAQPMASVMTMRFRQTIPHVEISQRLAVGTHEGGLACVMRCHLVLERTLHFYLGQKRVGDMALSMAVRTSAQLGRGLRPTIAISGGVQADQRHTKQNGAREIDHVARR